MTDEAPPQTTSSNPPAGAGAPPAGPSRAYKRSWRNLLINKRYQLRFTLFMVGLALVLMVGLGVWVMKVADETTSVGIAQIHGNACPRIPTIDGPTDPASPPPPPVPMRLDDGIVDGAGSAAGRAGGGGGSGAGSGGGSGAGSGAGSAAAPRHRAISVQIDESTMTVPPPPPPPVVVVPPDFVAGVAAHWACELRQATSIDDLNAGRRQILYVMVGVGLMLVVFLAFYGIKMTHRVAGPLFKVSLYLGKMRDGRLDKVYNLRKGDQLIDFYDHFKSAHAGVVTWERGDLDRLKALLAATAAAPGTSAAAAETKAALDALREIVARKEKALE